MRLLDKPIALKELQKMSQDKFGNMIKAVVDVEKKVLVVDGELHSDEEALLLSKGAKQENLWGINLYPFLERKNWIEFDSMINVRPSMGNLSRGVGDSKVRDKIIKIVNNLVKK